MVCFQVLYYYKLSCNEQSRASFCVFASVSLGQITKNGIAWSTSSNVLPEEISKFPSERCIILHSHQWAKVPISPQPCQKCVLLNFWDFPSLVNENWYLSEVWNFTFISNAVFFCRSFIIANELLLRHKVASLFLSYFKWWSYSQDVYPSWYKLYIFFSSLSFIFFLHFLWGFSCVKVFFSPLIF